MKDGWYYKSIGQVMGPVTLETLAELARDELLHPTDEVRRGPDGQWEPAITIVSLFPENAACTVESAADMEVAQDLADLDFQFGSSSLPEAELPTADELPPLAPSTPPPAWAAAPRPPTPESPAPQRGPAEPAFRDTETFHGIGSDETRVNAPPARSPRTPATAPNIESKPANLGKAAPAKEKPAPTTSSSVADSAPKPITQKPPTSAPAARKPPLGQRLSLILSGQKIALISLALACVAGAWFLIPRTEKDGRHVQTAIQLYGEFCQLRAKNATPAEWSAYVQQAEAKSDAMLTEFRSRSIRPNTVRAFLNRAFSEGFTPMIELMQKKTGSEPESVFVTNVNRAILEMDPKAPRLIMQGPSDVLAPTAEQLRQAKNSEPVTPQPGK